MSEWRKSECFCQQYLLQRQSRRDYWDTNQLPSQLLCVHETWPFLLLFWLSKWSVCCHFLQRQCSFLQDSTSIHRFPGCELCSGWQAHHGCPKWRQCHPESHLQEGLSSRRDCRLCLNAHQTVWLWLSWPNRRFWSAQKCCQWPVCSRHRKILSTGSHSYCWSHRSCSSLTNKPTTHKLPCPEPLLSGCCRTSPASSDRNHPGGRGHWWPWRVSCWSSWPWPHWPLASTKVDWYSPCWPWSSPCS